MEYSLILANQGRFPQSWRPTIQQLCGKLRILSDWDKFVQLMMKLEVEHHKLKEIKYEDEKLEARRREALDYWLRQNPDGTWNHIIDALRAVGEVALAEELEKEYQWKEPRAQSKKTYIQTDQPIKVKPVDREFCKIHLKKSAISHGYYVIVPRARMPASSDNRPVLRIEIDIKEHLMTFLSKIEDSENKADFRVGYEARFGHLYLMLQEGSENLRAASLKDFKPDLEKHNKKQFHLEIYHDIQPVLAKYRMTESREINVIDPFKFVMEGQEAGLYIAVIEEVKFGVFLLKAVYRQPVDQTNSATYDIVRPGRERYDIRIGDNCGPLVPVTRDSLSYRLAEELTAGMKRKRPDRSQLSFTPRGETSKGESKYFVRYFRQKVQTQYPWKGTGRWILAKYEVDTFKDVYDMEDAVKKFPEVKEYDHDFKPKQHKQELEVKYIADDLYADIIIQYTCIQLWSEKIFPKEVHKTRPSREEYLYMQSCETPLFLPGEGEPVPPHPWSSEELMRDFGEFLQAAYDVADTLERITLLKKH